jgi:polyisoprenoid-binding protein YceI
MRHGWLKAGVVAFGLVSLGSCASLVAPLLKPAVSTDLTKVAAGDYALDPAHAALLFRINHLGYSDLIGRFETFDASLTGDAADPAQARVEATVDMTSLDIANDSFAEELMGPDWFDAAAFPQAVFRSTAISVTGPTTADVTGDLTLHGATLPVTLQVTFNGAAHDQLRGAEVAGFSATTEIDRTAFGVSKYSGLLTDTVGIEIQAEFVKQSSGS